MNKIERSTRNWLNFLYFIISFMVVWELGQLWV
jgi:hypothetical protein